MSPDTSTATPTPDAKGPVPARRGAAAPPSDAIRWAPWAVLLVLVVGLLGYGTFSTDEPTNTERVQSLSESLRCPRCKSQSVAQSENPSALGVKKVLQERVALGQSDEEIRDYVASRYGREVLLDPAGKGFGALVWGVPVVVALLAVAGLVLRFRDWRPSTLPVTADDRDLVAQALSKDDRA